MPKPPSKALCTSLSPFFATPSSLCSSQHPKLGVQERSEGEVAVHSFCTAGIGPWSQQKSVAPILSQNSQFLLPCAYKCFIVFQAKKKAKNKKQRYRSQVESNRNMLKEFFPAFIFPFSPLPPCFCSFHPSLFHNLVFPFPTLPFIYLCSSL